VSTFMKYLVALFSLVFVVAAAPSDIASEVATTGFHVDSGTSATEICVSESVADARFSGGNLSIIVLVDEPAGGATAFAGALLAELDVFGTVLVVAPDTVGYEEDESFWSTEDLDAAVAKSLTVASDNDVVRTFVNTLTGGSGTCSSASVAGKSSWGPIAFFLIVIGGVGFLIWRSVRSARGRRAKQWAEAKIPVQRQIDAIANDILEIETEVKVAGDDEATRNFIEATEAFATAGERLAATHDAAALVDLSFELDLTIWRLDCAEAILDGNPLPPEPTKPEPAVPPPTQTASTRESSQSSTIPSSTMPTSLPQYQRRDARRSQYGADDMLRTVLAMQAMKGLGGRRSGSSSTSRSSSSTRSRSASRESSPTSRTRTRGGGRRKG
jgi:hypothetical protein